MSTKNTQNNDNATLITDQDTYYSNNEKLAKNNLLGVEITNETSEKILEYIYKNLLKNGKPYYIVTPNPEILMYATKHRDFKKILNNAQIALCDGVGIVIAGWILGQPYKERVTGLDMVERLCKKVANQPITVGFLGGQDKIAGMTAECLRKKFNGLNVVYAQSEWDENNHKKYSSNNKQSRYKNKVDKIDDSKEITDSQEDIDILFVAFGFPKQEEWMASHVGKISAKVMMGVGGSFDQIVDKTLRPPTAVQDIGFGWFYRLLRQPWRIKRQSALVEFIFKIIVEKIKTQNHQP